MDGLASNTHSRIISLPLLAAYQMTAVLTVCVWYVNITEQADGRPAVYYPSNKCAVISEQWTLDELKKETESLFIDFVTMEKTKKRVLLTF